VPVANVCKDPPGVPESLSWRRQRPALWMTAILAPNPVRPPDLELLGA
jgi:hypothetical protein